MLEAAALFVANRCKEASIKLLDRTFVLVQPDLIDRVERIEGCGYKLVSPARTGVAWIGRGPGASSFLVQAGAQFWISPYGRIQ